MSPLLWLGSAVNMLSKIWTLLSEFKMFRAVLMNWIFIKNSIGTVEDIINRMTRERTVPTHEEIDSLINIVRESLKREIIDMPNVDETAIERQLQEFQLMLMKGFNKQPLPETAEVKNG